VGKSVKFIKAYVAPTFTIPIGNVGTIVDYPGRDQGGSADQPDVENGIVKIKVKDSGASNIQEVGIPIDQLSMFIIDVPLGTPVS
jgi:hypothetical protein